MKKLINISDDIVMVIEFHLDSRIDEEKLYKLSPDDIVACKKNIQKAKLFTPAGVFDIKSSGVHRLYKELGEFLPGDVQERAGRLRI